MTITKNSLVEVIHNEVGLNKREAKEFIEEFFEMIKASLEEGHDIKTVSYTHLTLPTKRIV